MSTTKRTSDPANAAQVSDHLLKKQKLNDQLSDKTNEVADGNSINNQESLRQSESDVNNNNVVVPESTENAIDPVFGSAHPIEENSNKENTGVNVQEELQQAEGQEQDQEQQQQQQQNQPEQVTSTQLQENSTELATIDNGSNSSDVSLLAVPKTSVTDPEMLLKIKKLNHKEVERRRRENINIALRELQEVVPTTHSNKAQVIRKAVDYIQKLKEKEENLVNKWTLEKIITDQAINELANSNDKLKLELGKAYREIEHRKNIFENFIELVSKQENSNEIKEFLSKVNDLFIDDEDEDDDDDEEAEKLNTEQQIDQNIESNDQQSNNESSENTPRDVKA